MLQLKHHIVKDFIATRTLLYVQAHITLICSFALMCCLLLRVFESPETESARNTRVL